MLKVGEEEVGVMMGWEQGIMEQTVQKLCENHENVSELKVLNVGFGLGIVGYSLCKSDALHIQLISADRWPFPVSSYPTLTARHHRTPPGCFATYEGSWLV